MTHVSGPLYDDFYRGNLVPTNSAAEETFVNHPLHTPDKSTQPPLLSRNLEQMAARNTTVSGKKSDRGSTVSPTTSYGPTPIVTDQYRGRLPPTLPASTVTMPKSTTHISQSTIVEFKPTSTSSRPYERVDKVEDLRDHSRDNTRSNSKERHRDRSLDRSRDGSRKRKQLNLTADQASRLLQQYNDLECDHLKLQNKYGKVQTRLE